MAQRAWIEEIAGSRGKPGSAVEVRAERALEAASEGAK
jgi:hypothetical protein